MQWIFTGFTPFLDFDFNPSWDAAQAAANELSGQAHLLEVTFEDARKDAERLVAPDTRLIMIGLGSNRFRVDFERFAHNIEGCCASLITGAPLALETAMDTRALSDHWNQDVGQLRAGVSRDAGDYVCNALFYHALWLGRDVANFQAIFVHIPMIDSEEAQWVGRRLARTFAALDLEKY